MTQKARLNRLWGKASNGDKHSFGELFDEISPDIYRYARRRLPGDSQAEEVVAETFLQLWKRRDFTLEPDVSIRAWVFGIAVNLVRRQWRTSGRHDTAVNRLAVLDAVETAHTDVSQHVAQSVDANRRVRVVLAALERLPAETKELADRAGLGRTRLRRNGPRVGMPDRNRQFAPRPGPSPPRI